MNQFQLWKRGKYFYFRLQGEKTFHSTGQTSKMRAIDKIYVLLRDGAKNEIKLVDYAKDFFIWEKCSWIKRQHAKGRPFSKPVADHRRAHLIRYLFPGFGNRYIQDIKGTDIEKWLIDLPLANQTKNHILYTTNIILKEAKRERLIAINPLDDVEPMARDFKERSVFKLSELDILFPVDKKNLLNIWSTPEWSTLFLLLATTGIRSGEVRALQWRHVIWNPGGILILCTIKEDGTIGEPKSKEKRGIIVPYKVMEVLKWWYSITPYNNHEDLLFFGEKRDKSFVRKSLNNRLKAALEKVGIETKDRNLVVHSFRHTYNTLMRNVLPENLLREFTGHRSIKMTDQYDHPSLESRLETLEKSRDLIESIWT